MTKQTSTSSICLEAKPSVPVHYTFIPGTETSTNGKQLLVVFVSGLGDSMKSWNGALKNMSQLRQSKRCPPLLLYDRFGSGRTGRDPSDAGKEADEWHDLRDAAQDLYQLIRQVAKAEMAIGGGGDMDGKIWLVFVAHSIGALVALLYGKTFPGEAASFLLLDTAPTNTGGYGGYPDPDAPDFDATALPTGVTTEMLRETRKRHCKSPYNENMVNGEGLRWNNVRDYFPVVGAPKMIGPAKGTPLVTIVAHDGQTYAKQVRKMVGIPEILALTYNSSSWQRFLKELINVGEPHLRRGPVVAKGSGHFVQLDRPDIVAEELSDMLDQLYQVLDSEASKL